MLELFVKAGFIKWPLLLLSLVALAVFIEKWMALARVQHRNNQLISRLKPLIRTGGRETFVSFISGSEGPLANALLASLNKPTREARTRAIEDAVEIEIFYLESKLGLLATIASVGPLLGFLGTVIGIIQAFQKIEMAGGSVNPSVLAGGIWEALLGSAGGLFIGIPTIFAYNFLLHKIERIVNDMKAFGLDAVEFLSH